jgi:hypothetical protein
MKKNWLTILIIFLLTANLALLVTLLIRANNTNNLPFRQSADKRGFNSTRNSGKFEIEIADKLGMTQEQREQLKTFSMEFHNQKDELKNRINEVKGKYFENLSNSSTDPVVLNELADSLGALHALMIKLDHQHYKNIKSICTKEQTTILDSLGRLRMNNIRGENCQNGERRHKYPGNNSNKNN